MILNDAVFAIGFLGGLLMRGTFLWQVIYYQAKQKKDLLVMDNETEKARKGNDPGRSNIKSDQSYEPYSQYDKERQIQA